MTTILALLATTPAAHAELPPGTTMSVFEITNDANSTIGWYVVVGGTDVTAYGHTWEADTAYWFWTAASPFPSAWRLYWSSDAAPDRDPAAADAQTTTGPFDTAQTYTPGSSGSWWTVTRYVDGTTADSLGYVQNLLGTQYWWELDADAYLPVDADDYLQMTATSASSTPMYRCVDTVL